MPDETPAAMPDTVIEAPAATQDTTDASASVPSVEVAHDPELDHTVATTDDLAVQVTAPGADAHPSVLKRAATLLHEIMRRVIFDGEEVLDKIEVALGIKQVEQPDSKDADSGE